MRGQQIHIFYFSIAARPCRAFSHAAVAIRHYKPLTAHYIEEPLRRRLAFGSVRHFSVLLYISVYREIIYILFHLHIM